MLYELLGAVRVGSLGEIQEVIKTVGMQVLMNGGVIRGVNNWDTTYLPKRTFKNQASHTMAQHFLMRFDCDPETQKIVRTTLGDDPRMVKFSVVKLGEGKLRDISRVEGHAAWFT
ncbi:37S ribosomal protein MRP17 [Drechslerella dactyloides]|uniref:37S ribosomal protein MRP17 n=1 Tax=Drechslerella dactyloides TaxID=74499 RepID=A0AAD6J1P7_DREDA|nr:37S ribosomal protein MRP17 [Drechslerella dactyloides]